MKVDIIERSSDLERVYIAEIMLKGFRGKPLVEVQIFRPIGDPGEVEALKGRGLVGDPDPETPAELLAGATEEGALGCLLEAFTIGEIRQMAEYFGGRYGEQIESFTACPLNLPVPLGVGALGSLPEGSSSGFINFDQAPDYSLPFAVKGYYDLGGS